MSYILAIDPGNTYSAYVVAQDDTLKPVEFAKIKNEDLYEKLPGIVHKYALHKLAVEMVACYGMSVGKSIFDTCVWIGRFIERSKIKHDLVYRKDEKMLICGTMKSNDSNIRKELIRIFAKFDFKNGKGTKQNPDWFFGFKADIWQAYAVAYVVWKTDKRGE